MLLRRIRLQVNMCRLNTAQTLSVPRSLNWHGPPNSHSFGEDFVSIQPVIKGPFHSPVK
jgi:hypothetical protein